MILMLLYNIMIFKFFHFLNFQYIGKLCIEIQVVFYTNRISCGLLNSLISFNIDFRVSLGFSASPIAQLVKNPPVMRETWVQSLVRSPGREKGYPLQYSGLENCVDCRVHGVAKSRTRLHDFHLGISTQSCHLQKTKNKTK